MSWSCLDDNFGKGNAILSMVYRTKITSLSSPIAQFVVDLKANNNE